jgi:predicted nucleic acid-binding protein
MPRLVLEELLAEGAPAAVRRWAGQTPAWISVSDALPDPVPIPRLQAGERAAIALAQSANADVILLDEKSARRFAIEKGLKVVGVLGVLAAGANLGLVDLATAFEKLARTNFRYPPELLKLMLERFLSA